MNPTISAAVAILYLLLSAFLQSTSLGLNSSILSILFLLHRHDSIVQSRGGGEADSALWSEINLSLSYDKVSSLGKASLHKKMNTPIPLYCMGPLPKCKSIIGNILGFKVGISPMSCINLEYGKFESFYTRHR